MSAGKVVIVSDGEFEKTVLKSEIPVMLDFWAEWCQPCKMLAPTVEELAGEFEGQLLVGKLNLQIFFLGLGLFVQHPQVQLEPLF